MLVLIDGNAMGHAHHNGTTLNTGSMQTQAIYGFVRMMRDIRVSKPDDSPLVLWDGKAQFRYDLYPEYKANRETKEDPKADAHREAYRAQVPYIKAALKSLGIRQMWSATLEADDLAGYMVKNMINSGKGHILLITGDQDWLQLLQPGVTWFDPRGEGRKVSFDTFLESTGYFTPEEFLQGKALQGDTSDYIPGVGGIGKGTAPKFLAEWRSVEKFFEAIDSGKYTPKKRKAADAKTPHPEEFLASPEGRALFRRNMQLMDLRNPPAPHDCEVLQGQFNEALFRKFCDRLGFVSITRDWQNFVAPFRK